MKKILAPIFFALLMLGVSLGSSPILFAAEHGGATVKEHGGRKMKGKHHHHMEGSSASIKEAASLLSVSHPDLAAKLEKIAAEEEEEKE